MPPTKAIVWQAPRTIVAHFPTNASILTAPNVAAFIADADYELMSVSEIHETLGTDAGAVALDVKKSTGTQTAAAGATMLASTFNLKAAINTVVRKDRSGGGLTATLGNRRITKGDRVVIALTGVLTAVTGVCVTLVLIPVVKKPVY